MVSDMNDTSENHCHFVSNEDVLMLFILDHFYLVKIFCQDLWSKTTEKRPFLELRNRFKWNNPFLFFSLIHGIVQLMG